MTRIKMLTAKGPLLLWDLKDKSIQAHVSSVSSVSSTCQQKNGKYISMVSQLSFGIRNIRSFKLKMYFGILIFKDTQGFLTNYRLVLILYHWLENGWLQQRTQTCSPTKLHRFSFLWSMLALQRWGK